MTSKLKSRLEYLWRSCCCNIASQSDLFRLTYATELLKDLGWESGVLSEDGWQKLITKKPMLTPQACLCSPAPRQALYI